MLSSTSTATLTSAVIITLILAGALEDTESNLVKALRACQGGQRRRWSKENGLSAAGMLTKQPTHLRHPKREIP